MFYRLSISYLSIFLVIIVTLMLLFSMMISDTMKKETAKLNYQYSQFIMQSIDNKLIAINQTIIDELLNSEELALFFNEGSYQDPILNAKISSYLNALAFQNPLIDGIYLVRYEDKRVMSNRIFVPLEEYGDQPFINEMITNDPPIKWTNSRVFKELNTLEEKVVVSLVRKFPLLTGEKGLIVINIDKNELQAIITRLNDENLTYIEVYDQKAFLFSGNLQGSNNKKEAITTIQSPHTGWTYKSGFYSFKGELYSTISSMNYLWFVLCAFIIIIGVLLILIKTKQNVKPVEQLMSRIRSEHEGVLDTHASEFYIIEKSFDQLVEISKKYRAQASEITELNKFRLFKDLLERDITFSSMEWETYAKLYGLPVHFGAGLVAIIEIDKFTELSVRYKKNELDLYKFVISNVLCEITHQEGFSILGHEWLEYKRLSVLFSFDSSVMQPEDVVEKISKLLQLWISKHTSITLTVSIGRKVTSIEQIIESNEEALKALQYKIVLGNSVILRYHSLQIKEHHELFEHLNQLRNAADLYRLGKHEWQSKLSAAFDAFKTELLSDEQVKSLLYYFIFYLNLEMSKSPKEIAGLWGDNTATKLTVILDEAYDLNQLFQEWEDMLCIIQEKLKEKYAQGPYYHLIQEVRIFVEENYNNPDISLSMLSVKFNINAKYLSQLFKEIFGETFSELIQKLRMKKAITLLINTDKPIQDIAIEVGYLSSISFSLAFKRCEGVSPSHYRNKQIKT
ncbi:helix-turn-helix domain-containing protein [Paenibacillus sp. PL2-23]|uniref:helix-turn-helix domain-containing protein n=1 Tax=Paenibacillus sp. PL2-23 TaxID=2100729 RepID=UPI0030F94FC6